MSQAVINIDEQSLRQGDYVTGVRFSVWDLEKSLGYATSQDQETGVEMESILRDTFSTYFAVMSSLIENRMFGEYNSTKEAKNVMHAFAMYTAASTTKERYAIGTQESRRTTKSLDTICAGSRILDTYETFMDPVMEDIAKVVGNGLSPQDKILEVTGVVSTMQRYASSLAADAHVKRYVEHLSKMPFKVRGYTFKGFSYETEKRQKAKVDDIEQTVPKIPTIIGNDHAIRLIDRQVKKLGFYDRDRRANPYFIGNNRPPANLFAGKPGRGKTLLLNYAKAKLAEVADYIGLQLAFSDITNEINDSLHGNDIKNLHRLFDKVRNPEKLGILTVDEVDMVFTTRKSSDPSFIDRKNVNEMMQFLSGMDSEYPGNYMVNMATNRPGDLDTALRDRMGTPIEIQGPTTPEQYKRLLEIKLGPKAAFINVGTEFGRLCVKHDVTGRTLEQVATWASDRIENEDSVPFEAMKYTWEAKEKAILAACQRIKSDDLTEQLHERIRNERKEDYL